MRAALSVTAHPRRVPGGQGVVSVTTGSKVTHRQIIPTATQFPPVQPGTRGARRKWWIELPLPPPRLLSFHQREVNPSVMLTRSIDHVRGCHASCGVPLSVVDLAVLSPSFGPRKQGISLDSRRTPLESIQLQGARRHGSLLAQPRGVPPIHHGLQGTIQNPHGFHFLGPTSAPWWRSHPSSSSQLSPLLWTKQTRVRPPSITLSSLAIHSPFTTASSIWRIYPENLAALTEACDPFTFGLRGEDEACRKAAKFDVSKFATNFDPLRCGLTGTIKNRFTENGIAKASLNCHEL